MDKAVSVDISSVVGLLDQMQPRHLVNSMRSAYTKTVRVILRSVQDEYKHSFPGSLMYKAIHAKAYRSGSGAMVDLFYVSKGRNVDHNYVLRMLEGGTDKRETKRGYNRGSISRAAHFFQKGVASSIGAASSMIEQNINTAIRSRAEKLGLI